jgi:hypothetical protein
VDELISEAPGPGTQYRASAEDVVPDVFRAGKSEQAAIPR